MPIAKPDLTSTLRGVPVTIAVLGNDEGSNLAIVGYTLPVHGSLVLNPDRSFTYTSAANFVGLDGFAYTVRDGVGGTADGEVTINVTRPNAPPVAANDEVTTVARAAVDVAVLANDNDPDGDTLALLAIDAPGHGTVTVLPDQSIRYVPLPGFSGQDSFAYTVGDGMGGAATAQVLVTVGVATSPPLARDDAATTSENEAVAINVLANDNDPDGSPISLGGFTMPEHGTVSPTADHRLVYTPEAGFSGTDRFAYIVRDDDGESTTGHVTVTVTSSNTPPVPVSDFALSAGEPITLDLLGNDNDPDGDSLKLAALTLPIEGDIALQTDGRVTYNPPPGFIGTDSFTYQVTDGASTAEADVHISVSAPPVTTFANGYANQHELRLPAWASGAPVLDYFLLPVAEQRADLKSAANGGPVKSAQGFDIRFESSGGVKLGHVILSYDGVTGTLVALVNMPRALATAESIYLYTGKAGLAASEEDAAAARAGGWLAWYAGHPGADRSGQGRDLVASGPTATSMGLWPAANLDGVDDKFTQASSAWLNGLSALTVISLHQASRIDQKSEVFNLAAGAAAELSLHFANENNRLTATAKFGTTLHQFQSANERQTTQPQAVAFVAAAGSPMRMAIDGLATVPGQSTGNLTGTLSVADTLEWGAGGRGDLIHWSGKLAFLAFCASALPVAATEAMTAALIDPRLVYGIGDANTVAETNRSPVALALKGQTANAGQAKNYTVTGAAWDPNGDTLTVTDAVLITGAGTVSVANATQVRFSPALTAAGTFVVEFGLRDPAGRTSRSRIYGTVAASSSVDLFLNPFDKDSAHHRPLGANVTYGIPPGTLNAKVANPTYDAGVLGSRGRLALVRTFRVGSTKQGQKYLHRVTASHPSREIEWHTDAFGGGTGDGLPITLKMPAPGPSSPYSDDPSGDNEVLLYPRNGTATDLVDVFPQFNYDSRKGTVGVASARARDTYPIGGRDVRNLYNDPNTATAAWGPGAIDWRHPGGFLRGHEVDLTGATPIRHLLNATATRHSRQGAAPTQHVLSKRMAYPAWETDRPMPSGDNLGDIPYGTIIAVRWEDRDLRDSTTANPVRGVALNLTPFGKQLFDTFLYFGCCLCDGQGQIVDDAPVLQLRVDWALARDTAKEAAVEAALAKLLPHLWPVFNPRRHTGETERHSDGLCYVGGGGPLGPGSINNAWDV